MNLAHETAGELIAAVRMERKVHAGSYLLVEGFDDYRFYQRRIHHECNLMFARGRTNVLAAIRALNAETVPGVLASVDADYDHLEGCCPTDPNVVVTEHHDLEGLLLRGSGLDGVLAEYADLRAVRALETQEGRTFREALLARALPWGRIRWASLRGGLEIPLGALSHANYIDSNWQVDEPALFARAAELSKRGPGSLEAALAALPTSPDPWLVCQGHDLVAVLAVGLRGRLKLVNPDRPKHDCGADQLAPALRAGLHEPEWQASGLYRDIRAWEARVARYPVLKAA